jgi:subtilase family serine protease
VYYGDTVDIANQYYVNSIAASILGVSNNYSTGDSGDYYTLGASLVYDVSFPSGSPDATAVGGTSLALTSTGNYKWESGWGTNITLIGYAPPFNLGFYFGGGGGTSAYGTPAPAWQQSYLNNTYRQQPDVSMDADPYTGAEVLYTGDWNPGDQQYVTVIGGTSLSCPMFSGVWALAEQKAGIGNLGNAAQYVYYSAQNFAGSINDVQPVGSGHNAHGTIFYNGIPANYSQWDLAFPYQNSPVFYESILNAYPLTLTFGTDSSLTTGPGWDNVTGVGTPNGANFINPF